MSSFSPRRTGALVIAAAAFVAALVVGTAAAAGPDVYTVHDLVSDGSVSGTTTDASLMNGWGISAGPTTPWWVSNNATNTSTLYAGTGSKVPLTVAVAGSPTGQVFNGDANGFKVSQGAASAAARFIFATEDGTILGWAPSVAATTAVTGVDHSAQKAIYKGLTLSNGRLYATDFHNGRVDVFDSSWNPVSLPNGFKDARIPKGWGPFGIQALNGNVFVSYAKQDSAAKDDVSGGGLGYVDEFGPDGNLIARVAKQGTKRAPLNAPWGLALAPAGWGAFGGDLLVGNFGNGKVSAYLENTPGHWVYKGQLRTGDGKLIQVEGLWGMAFGNGAAAGPTTSLYFAAGPGDEKHGLFGSITAG